MEGGFGGGGSLSVVFIIIAWLLLLFVTSAVLFLSLSRRSLRCSPSLVSDFLMPLFRWPSFAVSLCFLFTNQPEYTHTHTR